MNQYRRGIKALYILSPTNYSTQEQERRGGRSEMIQQ